MPDWQAGKVQRQSTNGGLTSHNFTPFRDANPKCPAEARYKALAGGRGGLTAFQSADGIHWTRMAEAPVINRGAFDSQNLAFWDPTAHLYREYHRGFRDGVRDIMTGTSDDFMKWSDLTFLDYPGAAPEHLYTNAVPPCPRANDLLGRAAGAPDAPVGNHHDRSHGLSPRLDRTHHGYGMAV